MLVTSIRSVIDVNRYDVAEVRTYRTLKDEVTGKTVLDTEYHYYKLYTADGTLESNNVRGSSVDIKV